TAPVIDCEISRTEPFSFSMAWPTEATLLVTCSADKERFLACADDDWASSVSRWLVDSMAAEEPASAEALSTTWAKTRRIASLRAALLLAADKDVRSSLTLAEMAPSSSVP